MRTHDTIANTQTTTKDLNIQTSTPADKISHTTVTNKANIRSDGTVSDSILSTQLESDKKRRPSMSSKALVILGLSKKTNSASNLGYGKYFFCCEMSMESNMIYVIGKRFGFQRSEEIGVQPHLRSRTLQRQTSKEGDTLSNAPVSDSFESSLALSHQRDQYHSIPYDMK